MKKLYPLFYPENETNKDIVDVLTETRFRTAIFGKRHAWGIWVRDPIGINSVCQGIPVNLGNGFYERGFVNLEDDSRLYMIDSEKKIVLCIPNSFNLFYDQDKVKDENKYLWEGKFNEILLDFKERGYKIPE